jgi:peptidyl-prolyl cis-trans isomerase SurA
VLRTPITLTAAALAAALALSACGTVQLGAAAVTHTSRIPTATVSAEVSNLDAAYKAHKAKVQLQFPAAQMPQQVLSWLVRFRVREQMAARNHLTITRAESQSALASASAQAKQSGVTLTDLAVANGIPPDQINELGRYVAIQNQLLDRLDGGTLPTASAALQTLGNQFNTYQCRAAKSMGIHVNPQFGQLDYSQVSVIPAPAKLAAAPHSASPSPSASPTPSPQLTPAC